MMIQDGFDFGTASSIVSGGLEFVNLGSSYFLVMKIKTYFRQCILVLSSNIMISHVWVIDMHMGIQRAISYRFAIITHRMYVV